MIHSKRDKTNTTNQLKAQLGFYLRDLQHERASLKKAKSYSKWPNAGIKTMISQHKRGVKKTLADIAALKIRIRRRYKNGEIFKIL